MKRKLTDKKNRVLAIDSDTNSLQNYIDILGGDYEMHTAADGLTGLRVAEEVQPDLILLDVLLPGMNGYQVMDKLRLSEKLRRTPVAIITELGNSADEEKGLSYDAVDYIRKPFNEKILKLRIGHQIQLINQYRTIEQLSMTDQLTGLPNRRGFETRLYLEWNRTVREKSPLSLFMIDVDGFRHYNEKYGYLQGDLALQLIAKSFSSELKRAIDFTARLCEEEFAVILPITDSDGALTVAERIHKTVEAMDIPMPDGNSTKLTISIGVSTAIPNPRESTKALTQAAGQALAEAKKTGYNNIRSALAKTGLMNYRRK